MFSNSEQNKLHTIGPFVFKNLRKLIHVQLKNNTCINSDFNETNVMLLPREVLKGCSRVYLYETTRNISEELSQLRQHQSATILNNADISTQLKAMAAGRKSDDALMLLEFQALKNSYEIQNNLMIKAFTLLQNQIDTMNKELFEKSAELRIKDIAIDNKNKAIAFCEKKASMIKSNQCDE